MVGFENRLFPVKRFFERFFILIVCFLFITVTLIGAETSDKKTKLRERVEENAALYRRNIDSAYHELGSLIKESKEMKDTSLLLLLLETKCRYFYVKNDVEKLFDSAAELEKYASKYKRNSSVAVAHMFLAEAYSYTELYDKSLIELKKAENCISDGQRLDSSEIKVAVNILTSFANIYLQQNKPQEAILNLNKANQMVMESGDTIGYMYFQYTNYSNLSSIYTLFNMDSAKYYAELSSSMISEELRDPKIEAQNKLVLGRYYELNGNDSMALEIYLKAYNSLKINGVELNSKSLFLSILELSRKKGDTATVREFEALLQNVERASLESKYNSINKILDIEKSKPFYKKPIVLNSFLVLIVLIIGFVLYLYIKNKKPAPIDENIIKSEYYEKLIKLVETDDVGFMNAFEQLYPNFTKKLLSINSSLTRTEIEFCALLKLNLTTKQISQSKFIEVRTVQNKKYRIRKRLNIPESTDIYNWFETI